MSARKPPLLLQSGLTGAVWIVTAYTDRGNGAIVANTKHNVTDQFDAITDGLRARAEDAERERDDLQTDVDRYRARIHEAVDECQRRYAPDVKALHDLRACAWMARAALERQGEDAIKWWANTSQVARAFIVTTIQAREDAERRLTRIANEHQKHVDDHGGTYGECNDCGWQWPCPTYQWATAAVTDINCTWDLGECEFDHDHFAAHPGTDTRDDREADRG